MMEIIKNKEEVKSVMNIIQAFANGKTIQAIDPYEDEWVDQAALNFKALFEGQYRIKPEHTYRQFKDAEECWKEMQKHQPFAWVKPKGDDTISKFMLIDSLMDEVVTVRTNIRFNYQELLEHYTFADRTPFGIIEEE